MSEVRLIDADAAIQWVEENECYTDKFKRIMEGVIDKQPTVDAVQVVRCRECKYWEEESKFCLNKEGCYGSETTADWFCADGERRTE